MRSRRLRSSLNLREEEEEKEEEDLLPAGKSAVACLSLGHVL